jgi:hypothetical protein
MKDAFETEVDDIKKEIFREFSEILNKCYENLPLNSVEPKENLLINSNLKENLHLDFSCNLCGENPIKGIRYKCSVCKDFDICRKCEESFSNSHQHPFIKIRNTQCNPAFIKTITFDNLPNFPEEKNSNKEAFTKTNWSLMKSESVSIDENYQIFDLEQENDILNYYKKNVNETKKTENKENVEIPSKKEEVNFPISNQKENKDTYEISCLNSNEIFLIENSNKKIFKINLKIKNEGKKDFTETVLS